jgi:hypothetical protein
MITMTPSNPMSDTVEDFGEGNDEDTGMTWALYEAVKAREPGERCAGKIVAIICGEPDSGPIPVSSSSLAYLIPTSAVVVGCTSIQLEEKINRAIIKILVRPGLEPETSCEHGCETDVITNYTIEPLLP